MSSCIVTSRLSESAWVESACTFFRPRITFTRSGLRPIVDATSCAWSSVSSANSATSTPLLPAALSDAAKVLSSDRTAISTPITCDWLVPRIGTATAWKSVLVLASTPYPTFTSPASALLIREELERSTVSAPASLLFARRMPSPSVICTQLAPICVAASCDWMRTSASFFASTSARNGDGCANTSACPASALRRSSSCALICSRASASAFCTVTSAVLWADCAVTPSIAPSTAATTKAVPRKIFVVSDTLVPYSVGCVVLAELVLVRDLLESARVERDVGVREAGGGNVDLLRHLRRALVPHVKLVFPRRNSADPPARVRASLREVRRAHDDDERRHLRVNVAVHRKGAGLLELRGLRRAVAVRAEVKRRTRRRGKNIVAERILVRVGNG